MFKAKAFTRSAAMCWLLSLCVPTLTENGGYIYGVEVLWLGLRLSPLFIFAPFHVLSVASNVVFWRVIWRIERKNDHPSPAWMYGSVLNNFFVATLSAATEKAARGPLSLPGLLVLPGFYLWLAGFALLLWATVRREPLDSGVQTATGAAGDAA
jgi:hypothetical protein